MYTPSQNEPLLMDIDKLVYLSWRSLQLVVFYLLQTDFLSTGGDLQLGCASWLSKRDLRLESHYATPSSEHFLNSLQSYLHICPQITYKSLPLLLLCCLELAGKEWVH